jgi:ClpP class serine protease
MQKTQNEFYRSSNPGSYVRGTAGAAPYNWNLKFLSGQSYLRKMCYGNSLLSDSLPILEKTTGVRIGVINAAGGIDMGASRENNIGSDSMIEYIRYAKKHPNIKAVVIRIDSPGGHALASDLVWRELRSLAQVKPVVASMVDVAASGGYYFAMGCDQIVCEPLSVTGSIGVVTMKFNAKELLKKLGIGYIVILMFNSLFNSFSLSLSFVVFA